MAQSFNLLKEIIIEETPKESLKPRINYLPAR